MLCRSAIAFTPIRRAHAMSVLSDFSSQPLRLGQCGDEIAHQLRLANTPRVPANNDQAARR